MKAFIVIVRFVSSRKGGKTFLTVQESHVIMYIPKCTFNISASVSSCSVPLHVIFAYTWMCQHLLVSAHPRVGPVQTLWGFILDFLSLCHECWTSGFYEGFFASNWIVALNIARFFAAEMTKSSGCWCGERLRPIGWLLISTVLLSMLKHTGSRWAESLWLSEREGGCCGLESEGVQRATKTPPREGTAEVDQVKPFRAKSLPSSARWILPVCPCSKTHDETVHLVLEEMDHQMTWCMPT